jgi:cation transport regulator
MPYATNSDLPAPVRHHLPQGAQTIYREAFNGAWQQYATSERREEIAHRVAWSAVKKRYRKAGEMWVPLVPAESNRPARRRRS